MKCNKKINIGEKEAAFIGGVHFQGVDRSFFFFLTKRLKFMINLG